MKSSIIRRPLGVGGVVSVVLVCASVFCVAQNSAQPPETVGDAITLLTTQAGVRTSPKIVTHRYQMGREQPAVPASIRQILGDWGRIKLRGVRATFHADSGEIILIWHIDFDVYEEAGEARQKLAKILKNGGFHPANTPLLVSRFAPTKEPTLEYRKDSDVAEELRGVVKGGYVGGDIESGIRLDWLVKCDCTGGVPTHGELMRLRPYFEPVRVPARDAVLYDLVKDHPCHLQALKLTSQKRDTFSSWDAVVPTAQREALERKLEAIGFYLHRVHGDNDQRTWLREVDQTYVYIRRGSTNDEIRIVYHPPRRTPGRLAEIDEVTLPDPEETRLFRRAYELAEATAKKNWRRRPLRLDEYAYATWCSLPPKETWDEALSEKWMWESTRYPNRPLDRELHSVLLRGTLGEQANWELQAKWCPVGDGWGVLCERKRRASYVHWHVTFYHYAANAEHSDHAMAFIGHPLMQPRTYGNTLYYFQCSAIPITDDILADACRSPDVLRDHAVAMGKKLKEDFVAGFTSGKSISRRHLVEPQAKIQKRTRYQFTTLQSFPTSNDHAPKLRWCMVPPPEPMPVEPPPPSDRELTQKERDEVIREFHRMVDQRVSTVAQRREEIHHALVSVFPFDKMFDNAE